MCFKKQKVKAPVVNLRILTVVKPAMHPGEGKVGLTSQFVGLLVAAEQQFALGGKAQLHTVFVLAERLLA